MKSRHCYRGIIDSVWIQIGFEDGLFTAWRHVIRSGVVFLLTDRKCLLSLYRNSSSHDKLVRFAPLRAPYSLSICINACDVIGFEFLWLYTKKSFAMHFKWLLLLLLLLFPRLISFEIYRVGGSMCQGWHIERWSGMDACLRGPLER